MDVEAQNSNEDVEICLVETVVGGRAKAEGLEGFFPNPWVALPDLPPGFDCSALLCCTDDRILYSSYVLIDFIKSAY